MPGQFELVVRTADGYLQTLRLRAADAAAACAGASRDGQQVLDCKPCRTGPLAARGTREAGRHGLDLVNFTYEMAALMAAGLFVIDALRTLAAKESASAGRAALLDVVQGISEGLTLSAALQRHPGRYPALLIATISASEQTGELSTALRRYAEQQQSIKSLRDKVVGAAVYPALLLAMGALVVLLLVTVVVPKFAVLIESAHHQLPWSSRLLMAWGSFAAAHPTGIGGASLALLLLVLLAARKLLANGARSAWLDALPFIGPTIRKFRHAQLYRATGMLVRGGIAVPRALQLGASLLGDADRARLQRAIARIHEGLNLSAALQEVRLADPVAASMLAVAERTGALADILERIALFHEARLQRSVDLTSRLFEPVLMIVIGLVVGAIVVLMYLPIFDLASSLQ